MASVLALAQQHETRILADAQMKALCCLLAYKLDPTPAGFAESVSGGRWKRARHLQLLNQKLVEVAQGKCTRLMVFMPPQHGKSLLVSQYFPAWYLGQFPDRRIILTSYEAEFAATWGYKARNLLQEYGLEYFDVKVNPDSSARNRWDILNHDGGMMTAGVGGPITGKSGFVCIVDDPHKNSQEASSQVIRDNIGDWFTSTLYTRLAPHGAVIIIQTRWDEDDLSGRQLAEMKAGGEKWDVISLPAIAEENDPLGRLLGEALFPERYSLAELLVKKAKLGSYYWASLYQQRPAPQEGGMFKRSYFRYFHIEESYYVLHKPEGDKRIRIADCWRFQTCDPAATESEKSDYFVLSTWAVTKEKELLLLDVFREKAETTKHEGILTDQYRRWQPSFQGVENKTYGLNIIQSCKKKGLPIRPLKADTDKVSRARPAEARYETGMVYHRLAAPWLTDWEDELIKFPNGVKDDQVDTASYAAICIIEDPAKSEEAEYMDFGPGIGSSQPGMRV